MNDLKYISELDFEPFANLIIELESMLNSNKIYWHNNQICLNSIDSEPENFILGTGSLNLDWKNAIKGSSTLDKSFDVPKKTQIYNEEDFTVLCSVFTNTMFEEIYNYVNRRNKLGRVRLMKLDPKTCLSWHKDTSSRIHYVLKSSEGNKIVVEDECLHLIENKWYKIDTTKHHTVFNGSFNSRIHLVFVCL